MTMDGLESQVEEIRTMADSPQMFSGYNRPTTATAERQEQQTTESTRTTPKGSTDSRKRKDADDGGSTGPGSRTKRNRYISLAW